MFEKLKNILVEELSLNPDDITMTAELANDLGINSLELADLVLLCEDEFGFEFSEDDIVVAPDLDNVELFQNAIKEGIYFFAQLEKDSESEDMVLKKTTYLVKCFLKILNYNKNNHKPPSYLFLAKMMISIPM